MTKKELNSKNVEEGKKIEVLSSQQIEEYLRNFKDDDLPAQMQIEKLNAISNQISIKNNFDFDYKKVPLDDEKVYKAFSSGSSDSVLLFGTSSFKKYLQEFQPKNFNDLAIIRTITLPGLTDLFTEILKNKNSGKFKSQFTCCGDILFETYGVLLYQEQLIQIVQRLAGYSYEEADSFYRDLMRKKLPILMTRQSSFIKDSLETGFVCSEDEACDVFDSFFACLVAYPKSLAISYTLLIYWDMYFKVNYPLEYSEIAETNTDINK